MLRTLAIVTGASRGFGLSLARELALLPAQQPSGWWNDEPCTTHDILLLGRDEQRVASAVATVATVAAAGVNVLGYAADFGDMAALERTVLPNLVTPTEEGGWLPAPLSHFSSVLLVHNAATCQGIAYSWELPLDTIRKEMEMNVISPAALTSTLIGAFKKSRACREVIVVNLSSVSVDKPYEAFGLYATGKAARAMMTAVLGREADLVHNPRGTPPVLRCLSYAPGPLDTDMQAEAREAIPDDAPLKAAFVANKERLVDPAEPARRLVQLLQGPRTAWANGQHLSLYDLRSAAGDAALGTAHPLDYHAATAAPAHTTAVRG